jgi:hypothetical protein
LSPVLRGKPAEHRDPVFRDVRSPTTSLTGVSRNFHGVDDLRTCAAIRCDEEIPSGRRADALYGSERCLYRQLRWRRRHSRSKPPAPTTVREAREAAVHELEDAPRLAAEDAIAAARRGDDVRTAFGP